MDKLIPGRKTFKLTQEKGEIIFNSRTLDWTAKVVCLGCNTTWMSAIENEHAKPVMTPLILGETGIKINQSQADSLARFAFKTAVVVDYISRDRQPFFSRFVRHGFKESHAIPASTGMWLSAFAFMGQGNVKSVYHEGSFPAKHRFQVYALTYCVGHLVFQVVSLRNPPPSPFRPRNQDAFKHLAVGFWPWIPSGIEWPLSDVLKSVAEFDNFADRWGSIVLEPVPRRH
jgi:hypothetical protein